MQEKYLEALKKFRLIDDAFFSACFDDNVKDVEYILRIILEKDDLKVLEVQTQKSIENIYGRSVRFDVFATDTQGKLYNIEVQRADAGAIPERARYNSVMLDYHELNKQEEFKELPNSFVIFITENDVIGDDEKIYHIDRIVRETGKEFGDGTHIIYVNGSFKGEEGKPLDDLIHDFLCENPKDMRHKQLADRVKFLKENKNEVNSMSSIIAEIFKDEIAEAAKKAAEKAEADGKEKTLIENIRNLMETSNFTAKQAMNALKVPVNDQSKYLALI
ncbi:MAG: Rpn family recombination-promoting nuclease/putative transposase [Selenomonadaceae bacterium]|nr:Rpn family recombination-promoting nuclease/putative transposase [Selenomonadaceae bacterium]